MSEIVISSFHFRCVLLITVKVEEIYIVITTATGDTGAICRMAVTEWKFNYWWLKTANWHIQ